jgi:exosortase K
MNATKRHHAQNILFYLLIAAVAFVLKSHYSRAGADDLTWILAPTAFLVETLSGIQFLPESGAGYFSPGHRYLIAPACAGVNFLIIAFCMAAVSGVHRLGTTIRKSVWLLLSAGTALGATLVVNTVRIILSMALYGADIYSAALTPERIHRIAGVAVYFLFLYLLFVAISRMLNVISSGSGPAGRHRSLVSLWPLGWYLAFAIGVPFLNHAYQKAPDRFLEHTLMVLMVSLGVFTAARGIQGACHAALKGLRSGFGKTA